MKSAPRARRARPISPDDVPLLPPAGFALMLGPLSGDKERAIESLCDAHGAPVALARLRTAGTVPGSVRARLERDVTTSEYAPALIVLNIEDAPESLRASADAVFERSARGEWSVLVPPEFPLP